MPATWSAQPCPAFSAGSSVSSAVFWLAAVFGVLSIISVLLIPAGAIDDKEARGLKQGRDDGKASGFRVLLECKPLLILAAALACFHLGNGAMLPLYGMALAATKQGDPATFVALTIVVAQAVMIVASILAMRMAEKEGYWLVLLISFIALPDPGSPRRLFHQPVGRLSGTGARRSRRRAAERRRSRPRRANPQWHRPDQCRSGGCDDGPGLGASLSPAIGGWIAQDLGYSLMFLILGGFALVSIALWVAFAAVLKPACASETTDTQATPAVA